MNEIQEYRKASAEALEFEIASWQPDTDLNQMGMIEDWLIKNKWWPAYLWLPLCGEWQVTISADNKPIGQGYFEGNNKSKSIAFMKAFMEYIKS